jgi:hypothetical protein
MANIVSIQILTDGPRNTTVKLAGILDTADIAVSDLVNPALLQPIDANGTLATRLVIDKISYNIEAGLGVNLFWDATADDLIATLVSSGDDLEFKKFGGVYCPESAGTTGKIQYSTQGWSGGAVLSFNVILEMRKSRPQ